MRRLNFLLIFLSLYLLQSATTTLAHQKAKTHNDGYGVRIIDGTDAAGLYYHAVSITIINLNSWTIRFGGGSIISAKHVLTTAYIVLHHNNEFRIDYRLPNSTYGRTAYGKNAVSHPDYDSTTSENNIAIIICEDIFPTVTHIPITNLIPSVDKDPDTRMIGIGYGVSVTGGADVSRIPYAANTIVDNDLNCLDMLDCDPPYFPSTHRCGRTFRLKTGQFCEGDRGVGLISNHELWNELNTTTLVGLVAVIDVGKCNTQHNGHVYFTYIPVGLYAEWIQSWIG